MSGLPVISGREATMALERLGYQVARQRGSHVRLGIQRTRAGSQPLCPFTRN
jgi:predicted RNA binding protein YcfA (HicA-like mRNA interferase family)